MAGWLARVPPVLWWVPIGVAVNDSLVSLAPATDDAVGLSGAGPKRLLLVDKLSPRLYRYSRGSVAVFTSPTDPDSTLLRRVVAVEGDWFRPVPSSSSVLKMPAGRCWLESEGASGDRPRPPDSHQWGPVPLALVDGRALAVVWPPQRWAWLSGGSQPSRILAHGHAGPEDETWPYR